MMPREWTIVGAGISGLTAARALVDRGRRATVVDERPYIGGNCADSPYGPVRVHLHGPHCFHTNSRRAWDWMGRFGDMIPACPEVWADTDEGMVPLPFNDTARAMAGDWGEEKVRDLVYRGHSQKVWGVPWDSLPPDIRNRVPIRPGAGRRYFGDAFCGVPEGGYSSLFWRMAEGADVLLGAPASPRDMPPGRTIYTGRPDRLFAYKYGMLAHRTLRFRWQAGFSRGKAVVTRCMAGSPSTRTTDYMWYTNPDMWAGSGGARTVLVDELPGPCGAEDTPHYPMRWLGGDAVYERYRREADSLGILLLGRLGRYDYLNMDQCVLAALDLAAEVA